MNTTLETRISGSPNLRLVREFFGNSFTFPLFNILLESLIENPLAYLSSLDPYLLIAASLAQAVFLTRWKSGWQRLPGNLIGPALYTLVEIGLDGMRFFASPNHNAYWAFALAFGLLQAIRAYLPSLGIKFIIVLEDVIRSAILLTMYYIFEAKTNPQQTGNLQIFLQDSSHTFVALTAFLLGANIGLANLAAEGYLNLLRETSTKLRTYSEWFLGRNLLGQALESPESLSLKRVERCILFVDIRGFTAWSEARSPEEVVGMLNRYYQTAEPVLLTGKSIKFKFTADEVLAVFASVEEGLDAALKLRIQINNLLNRHGLGVGMGVHFGPVVEGLVGSKDIKFYDVIGDTANTAKRLENAAGSGEIFISEAVRLQLGHSFRVSEKRFLTVKGKEAPLLVYSLE